MEILPAILIAVVGFILGLSSSLITAQYTRAGDTKKELLYDLGKWIDKVSSVITRDEFLIKQGVKIIDTTWPKDEAVDHLTQYSRWIGVSMANAFGGSGLKESLNKFNEAYVKYAEGVRDGMDEQTLLKLISLTRVAATIVHKEIAEDITRRPFPWLLKL